MKRILFILTTLFALLFSSFSAHATVSDSTIDGIDYWIISTNGATTACLISKSDGKFEGDVVVPDSVPGMRGMIPVTGISSMAFYGCSGLTSVTIPKTITDADFGLFRYCYRLTSVVVDKNNVTYDSRDNCNAIIETSTNKLVSGCKNTIIPNSVTSIGEYAFYGSGLTSVTIPNSITYIGEHAFHDSSLLTELVSLAVEPPVCGDKAFAYINKAACQLLVPKESVNKYKVADQWKEFKYISECSGVDDVSVDTPDALYEVYNLQGVRVGSGMREAEITADALPHGIYILVSPQGRKKLKI